MDRDRLFLVAPDFEDPEFPQRRFYCWHCALIEGVLASFPALAASLDVVRIGWARPRVEVVKLVGEAHQWLPLMILGDGESFDLPVKTSQGHRFIVGKDSILAALSRRHGFPEPHP